MQLQTSDKSLQVTNLLYLAKWTKNPQLKLKQTLKRYSLKGSKFCGKMGPIYHQNKPLQTQVFSQNGLSDPLFIALLRPPIPRVQTDWAARPLFPAKIHPLRPNFQVESNHVRLMQRFEEILRLYPQRGSITLNHHVI